MFFEILLEGEADVPAIRSILTRCFEFQEGVHFRLHPHKGKGTLPQDPSRKPDPAHRGLLHQLPAKLRGYHHLPAGCGVVVLVDADNDDCTTLKQSLVQLYGSLERKPPHVLFRIAVEETESWLLADRNAIREAYPKAKMTKLPAGPPDQVIGAWERLAEVLGKRPRDCDGQDKYEWATHITPFLDLEKPKSPSLRAFVTGMRRLILESDR